MKQIKPVVLKEATSLSPEEMKLVFGGSSAGSGVTSGLTSCATTCGSQRGVSIVDCKGSCSAFDGYAVVCSGPNHVLKKYCNGTSSFV